MCELLVKSVDAAHSDVKTDRRDFFKRGDVVAIKPDDHAWGAAELNSAVFRVVKMPGVAVNDMRHLLAPDPTRLNDVYPKALLSVRRLTGTLVRDAREAPNYRLRRYRVNDNDEIETKGV